MGEAQQWLFEPNFNRAVKVRASDERITSDSGLLLLREADHRLGLTEWLAEGLDDPRQPDAIRYQMVELLRERLYALALGYATQDDADRLAHDPAMKMAAWDRPGEQTLEERLASQPTQSRLIRILASSSQNLNAVRDGLAESVERHLKASTLTSRHRPAPAESDTAPSTSTASRSKFTDRKKAERTTVTTKRRFTIRWSLRSRSPVITTAHGKASDWATASFTPRFAKVKFILPMGLGDSSPTLPRRLTGLPSTSTFASMPATRSAA